MYARLYQNMPSLALTDDTKYPCSSLPIPGIPGIPGPAFSLYEEPVIHNREYFQHSPPTRPHHVSPPPRERFQSVPPPQRTRPTSPTPLPSRTPLPMGENELLPVLDCRFNLREVCKQAILLEDHLSHDKKRCTDCCIKHFLALEGLCEEAVTLDRDAEHLDIRGLAQKIRDLQKLWYEDPTGNAHHCSQELRKMRKGFMMDVFPMIFEEKSACSDGMCTFSPRK